MSGESRAFVKPQELTEFFGRMLNQIASPDADFWRYEHSHGTLYRVGGRCRVPRCISGVSFKKLSPTSTEYQLLKVGRALFVANTAYHRAFPPAFLNSVWTIIAVVF
jgi:hypothetical protein